MLKRGKNKKKQWHIDPILSRESKIEGGTEKTQNCHHTKKKIEGVIGSSFRSSSKSAKVGYTHKVKNKRKGQLEQKEEKGEFFILSE